MPIKIDIHCMVHCILCVCVCAVRCGGGASKCVMWTREFSTTHIISRGDAEQTSVRVCVCVCEDAEL